MGNPTESPGGFSWDFLSQPLTCLQFWLFLLSSLQGSACVLLSLAKADSKVGLQIYGRPLEAKAAEIPVRKSDLLTLALVLDLTEKIRISSWRKPRSDLIVNRSLKTPVKIQLQRDSPEAGGGNTGEKRNVNNPKQELMGSQSKEQPLLTLKSLSMCNGSSKPWASINLTWKETHHWMHPESK